MSVAPVGYEAPRERTQSVTHPPPPHPKNQ
jgi:hypothetical protein